MAMKVQISPSKMRLRMRRRSHSQMMVSTMRLTMVGKIGPPWVAPCPVLERSPWQATALHTKMPQSLNLLISQHRALKPASQSSRIFGQRFLSMTSYILRRSRMLNFLGVHTTKEYRSPESQVSIS